MKTLDKVKRIVTPCFGCEILQYLGNYRLLECKGVDSGVLIIVPLCDSCIKSYEKDPEPIQRRASMLKFMLKESE